MTDKTKLLYSKAVGKIQDSCRFHSRRILNTPEGEKLSPASLATKTSTFAVLDLLVELGLVELDRSAQAKMERDCKGLRIDPAPISDPKPETQKRARKRGTKAQAKNLKQAENSTHIAICKGKGSDDCSSKFMGSYEKVLADVVKWWTEGHASEPMAYDPEDPRLFWYPEYPDETEVGYDDNGHVTWINCCDGEGPTVEIDKIYE